MALPPPTLAIDEQETLALVRSAALSEDPAAGDRASRRLLALTELREVVVHPDCVAWAEGDQIDDAVADMDILRLLAGEVMELPGDAPMRQAWLRAATRVLDARLTAERADGGLWAAAPNDMNSLDGRILEHQPQARERAGAATSAWAPLSMESQQAFLPPETAIAWPLTTSSPFRAP